MSPTDNLPAVRQNETLANTEVPSNLLKEFLDNQRKELELKGKQFELEKQKDDHAFEWTKNSLDAQIVDRDKERVFHLQGRRILYIFTTVLSALFIGLLIVALIMNKDQVAMEIIKAVIFISSGGAGGYAVGKYTGSHSFKAEKTKKESD